MCVELLIDAGRRRSHFDVYELALTAVAHSYLNCAKDLATSRLQNGAALSARKRSALIWVESAIVSWKFGVVHAP
jgi:hypothetical protein